MAKILVTGAAGFIGSKLAYELAKRGDEVIGVDNINDYYDALLRQLLRAVDEHMMRPMHTHLWVSTQEAEEAVKLCEETPLWDASLTKFAAL